MEDIIAQTEQQAAPVAQPEAAPAQEVTVVEIQFRPGQKVYYFDPNGISLSAGDPVIMDTARGPEFGTCVSGIRTIPAKDVVAPLRSVLRRATDHDMRIVNENRRKEKLAHDACLQRIEEMQLDMQLVSAECAFDGSKILFFFTADERVDFRELVKNLASQFHTRIELRQIGVRDKAKMVGGLGICGRPFCCASFLDDFQPVSIKMAKTQNLSLNPTKISGTCGRLMCCLKYEQDAYEDLLRTSPKAESFVDTPDGRGTVIEVDLLRQRVKVKMEEHPETIGVYANTDIAVLRNGKAKKNDPPIPADLAPISGNRKPQRREEPQEGRMFLDPIRFRYSTESIVDEPEEVEVPLEEETPDPKPHNKSRRRRGKSGKPKAEAAETQAPAEAPKAEPKAQEPKPQKPKQPKPKAEPKPKADAPDQPAKEQPAKAAEGEAKPHKPRRRPNHHRHHKPKSGDKPAQGQ